MSFLFGNSAAAERRGPRQIDTRPPPEEARQEVDRFYSDLMARRPALDHGAPEVATRRLQAARPAIAASSAERNTSYERSSNGQ